jgi:hypothetical protein
VQCGGVRGLGWPKRMDVYRRHIITRRLKSSFKVQNNY